MPKTIKFYCLTVAVLLLLQLANAKDKKNKSDESDSNESDDSKESDKSREKHAKENKLERKRSTLIDAAEYMTDVVYDVKEKFNANTKRQNYNNKYAVVPNIVKTMAHGTHATASVGYQELSKLAGNVIEKMMCHGENEKPTKENKGRHGFFGSLAHSPFEAVKAISPFGKGKNDQHKKHSNESNEKKEEDEDK